MFWLFTFFAALIICWFSIPGALVFLFIMGAVRSLVPKPPAPAAAVPEKAPEDLERLAGI